jgi:hypothetical protein
MVDHDRSGASLELKRRRSKLVGEMGSVKLSYVPPSPMHELRAIATWPTDLVFWSLALCRAMKGRWQGTTMKTVAPSRSSAVICLRLGWRTHGGRRLCVSVLRHEGERRSWPSFRPPGYRTSLSACSGVGEVAEASQVSEVSEVSDPLAPKDGPLGWLLARAMIAATGREPNEHLAEAR